jgi:hypothetical protein
MGTMLLVVSCAQQPSEPCPTDDALIAHFHERGAELTKVVANPQDEGLRSAAGVLRAVREPDGRTWLWMWHKDFPGPGGVTKGYLYGEPPPPSLVDSIDENSEPGSPEEKELYRHIERHWYLFYRSHN